MLALQGLRRGESEVQTGSPENGYSCSICVLGVIALESFIMRARYVNKADHPIDRKSCVEFLKSLYPDFDRVEELREIFVLRDIIAHNHLWKIDFAWDEEWGMKFLVASKDPASGDQKYKSCVNMDTLKTTKLRLNVNPIKIGKPEVVRVIEEVWNTLTFLENKDRSQCNVSDRPVRKGNEFLLAKELFGNIRSHV
jgi:hypothetical protein